MPVCALANHNWLGRLCGVQQKLSKPEYLGHRLLMSLARVVTTKVVWRPDTQTHEVGSHIWHDAFRAKGLKGSGICVDNARRTSTELFPPASLGDSFVAVFVGCGDKVEHGIFGRIDATEFADDAAALRAVNDVYARARVDEEELSKWPSDGSVPRSLAECCIAVPECDPAAVTEVPGVQGPAEATSHGQSQDTHDVSPWVSAVDPAPEDDSSAPVLWATLASKLEDATDLGSRIKVNELSARVETSAAIKDEVSRDLLLETCQTLQKHI